MGGEKEMEEGEKTTGRRRSNGRKGYLGVVEGWDSVRGCKEWGNVMGEGRQRP